VGHVLLISDIVLITGKGICFTRLKIQSRFWNDGHVTRMGERRGSHTDLVGKFDGKRPLGRLSLGRKDDIKTGLH
jgi:hypothetical protein